MNRLLLLALTTALICPAFAADAPKPLKVLLITGGCCHDYAAQKDILKKGIEERAYVVVDLMHSDIKTTSPVFPCYADANWAKGYDVVIHDECASDVKDIAIVDNLLKAHEDGVPAVNLHCAMHSYRTGTSKWFDYLGLQSASHGPQLPIILSIVDDKSPILKGTEAWITGNEELYNNIKVHDGIRPLLRGKQGAGDKPGENDTLVMWTNEYGPKKTRVFSTTLGHNNALVSDARYLDVVTRGVLWAAGKLSDDGTPVKGFGPQGK